MNLNDLATPIFGFNINDQFDLQGIVAGLNAAQQNGILLVSINAIKFSELTYLIHLVNAAKEESESKLFLQLDHCNDIDLIKTCVESKFDLIMADFSHLDYSENVKRTLEVVKIAHKNSILVEGELGTVPTLNDDEEINNIILSDPKLSNDFTVNTGIDLLAISVGNIHGFKSDKPDPDFTLITQIKQKVKIPLVLHGADFYSNQTLKKSFNAGITKANIGPELRNIYVERIKTLSEKEECKNDHRLIFGDVRQAISEKVFDKTSILKQL